MPSSFGNAFVKAVLNSPLHPLLGPNMAVITVYGWKTGKAYSTPINVTPGEGSFSATSKRERTWWRNLRVNRQAHLRVAGKDYTVQGEIIETHEDVIRSFERYFERHPKYVKYFGIQRSADGNLRQEDLKRAAGERVFVILTPTDPA
jgi:hypothetical protein